MALNARKFEKIRDKVEKKLIGSYGSSNGLGNDLVIRKYVRTTNQYGDATDVFDSESYTKGIEIASTDFDLGQVNQVGYVDGDVRLYIPIEFEVDDSESVHYEFFYDGKLYLLDFSRKIGHVSNANVVVKEINLKLKT